MLVWDDPRDLGGIYAAQEFDDGTGPSLWVGGDLGQIEGVEVQGLARYRPGLGWEPAGTMNSIAADFQVWDDGAGPALYVSGNFTQIDGKPINRIARWDPKARAWKPLGSGLDQIGLMEICDDGNGPALWARGAFSKAGGKPHKYLAKWDGKAWSGVQGSTSGGIGGLGSADFGNGPTLYMTGAFSFADNYPSSGFAAYEFCPKPLGPADLDGSGSVDLFDFLTFVNLFNAGDGAADCDGDGALTVADFTCYSALFAAGCP